MFIDDLVYLLQTAGVGVAGSTIFWSSNAPIPAGDGPYLSVIETGGSGPWLMHDTFGYLRPAAQILVRGKSFTATRNMIANAYAALARKRNMSINTTWYVSIDTLQEPFDLAADESGRIRYVFNVIAVKRP